MKKKNNKKRGGEVKKNRGKNNKIRRVGESGEETDWTESDFVALILYQN